MPPTELEIFHLDFLISLVFQVISNLLFYVVNHTSFILRVGLQSSSSFKILRQTFPLGYIFGWNRGGQNLHLL